MVRMVKEILGEDKALLWWKTSNPMLGGISPMWMSSSSVSERGLRNFVFDAYEDHVARASVSASADMTDKS
jgi:hypothetical protein